MRLVVGLVFMSIIACAKGGQVPTETAAAQPPPPVQAPEPGTVLKVGKFCGEIILTNIPNAYLVDFYGMNTPVPDGLRLVKGSCNAWGLCKKDCQYLIIEGIPVDIFN